MARKQAEAAQTRLFLCSVRQRTASSSLRQDVHPVQRQHHRLAPQSVPRQLQSERANHAGPHRQRKLQRSKRFRAQTQVAQHHVACGIGAWGVSKAAHARSQNFHGWRTFPHAHVQAFRVEALNVCAQVAAQQLSHLALEHEASRTGACYSCGPPVWGMREEHCARAKRYRTRPRPAPAPRGSRDLRTRCGRGHIVTSCASCVTPRAPPSVSTRFGSEEGERLAADGASSVHSVQTRETEAQGLTSCVDINTHGRREDRAWRALSSVRALGVESATADQPWKGGVLRKKRPGGTPETRHASVWCCARPGAHRRHGAGREVPGPLGDTRVRAATQNGAPPRPRVRVAASLCQRRNGRARKRARQAGRERTRVSSTPEFQRRAARRPDLPLAFADQTVQLLQGTHYGRE